MKFSYENIKHNMLSSDIILFGKCLQMTGIKYIKTNGNKENDIFEE